MQDNIFDQGKNTVILNHNILELEFMFKDNMIRTIMSHQNYYPNGEKYNEIMEQSFDLNRTYVLRKFNDKIGGLYKMQGYIIPQNHIDKWFDPRYWGYTILGEEISKYLNNRNIEFIRNEDVNGINCRMLRVIEGENAELNYG